MVTIRALQQPFDGAHGKAAAALLVLIAAADRRLCHDRRCAASASVSRRGSAAGLRPTAPASSPPPPVGPPVVVPPSPVAPTVIVSTALMYRGIPYRNGGSDPSGFDCSGFVQWVFAQNGIQLPREVHDQHDAGQKIDLRDVQPGDLLFFETVSRGHRTSASPLAAINSSTRRAPKASCVSSDLRRATGRCGRRRQTNYRADHEDTN